MNLPAALLSGEALSADSAECAARAVLAEDASPVVTAALLTAMRLRGETATEVAAFARVLRAAMVPVAAERSPLLDTCGTGGGTFRCFNVSTASAFVLAATGVCVAKHGNRAMSGVCGSADVLESLGAHLDLPPQREAQAIDTIGIAFLFAQAHHPILKRVAPVRRELGFRTIFNLVGPLCNPAGAGLQVLGVPEPGLVPVMADALRELGAPRAMVVHSLLGACEILPVGETIVANVTPGGVRTATMTRRDFGLDDHEPDPALLQPASTLTDAARVVRDVLAGRAATTVHQVRSDAVALNAAAGLIVAGRSDAWPDALALARETLASGRAIDLLDLYADFTRQRTS